MVLQIKSIFYTWRYFFINKLKPVKYFIYGYKPTESILSKQGQFNIQNKLDLVNWFTSIQKDKKLVLFSKKNKTAEKIQTNFELYLGKNVVDTNKVYGYFDTRVLEEFKYKKTNHLQERDLLIRHLIFYFFLKKNKINNVSYKALQANKQFLNLLITFPEMQRIDDSNKLLFLLNTSHLSNSNILNKIKKLPMSDENYLFFFKKNYKRDYHQLAEYIYLFHFHENETKISLSGTVDRILQEGNWQGRYKALPTIVKGLDNADEFITRLGWFSYKADINNYDILLTNFEQSISKALVTFPSNTLYDQLPFLNSTIIEIPLQQDKKKLVADLTISENNSILLTLQTNFAVFSKLNLNALVFNEKQWLYFNQIFIFYLNTVQNNNTSFLKKMIDNKDFYKYKDLAFFTPYQRYCPIQQNYYVSEYSMLSSLFAKFNQLFFLRASVGANWGFIDIELLNEELEKQEKNKFYNVKDDAKYFYYFLNSKDQRTYEDNTYTLDIKEKRFIEDVYTPSLVKPHVRPYNWLRMPEMSFSPFFLFLKNVNFFWYTLLDFSWSENTPQIFDRLILKKMYFLRFLTMDDRGYISFLKLLYSNNFFRVLFNEKEMFKLNYFINIDSSLSNNMISNTPSNFEVNALYQINSKLKELHKLNNMPNYFLNSMLLKNNLDLYKYRDYFSNSNVLETTLRIEQRHANQMRFNFMFKLGMSKEHSWFFLYNSPSFFKQTVAYQAWARDRVSNTYVWEHDNPFLIQQIFRPYTLDLTRDITLYKYKADIFKLLLYGFREAVFAETFLVKNYYTQLHKNRSIFEIAKYTIPFFLFDSDLYSISQIPETVIYEHISAFGIPALERQWKFDEIRIDLSERKKTSEWPDYLFNSKAYNKLLWTPRMTKNIFNTQEQDFSLRLKLINKKKKATLLYQNIQQINQIPVLTKDNTLKLYSYFIKKILLSSNIFFIKKFLYVLKKNKNFILKTNLFIFWKYFKLFKQIRNKFVLYQKDAFSLNLFYRFCYENFYLFTLVFDRYFNSLFYNRRTELWSDVNDISFYVVNVMLIYYCLLFF